VITVKREVSQHSHVMQERPPDFHRVLAEYEQYSSGKDIPRNIRTIVERHETERDQLTVRDLRLLEEYVLMIQPKEAGGVEGNYAEITGQLTGEPYLLSQPVFENGVHAAEPESLKPYKSFIIAHVRDGIGTAGLLDQILEDTERILKINENSQRTVIGRSPAHQDHQIEVAYLHFVEVRTPTWTEDESVSDTINQLVLLCRKNRHVAICLSDNRFRSAIMANLDQDTGSGLGALAPIDRGLINAAFVQGAARTLWLSGTHRRTTVKADSKILSGTDLGDALSPLEDQSYYFTAARCNADIPKIKTPVGTAPRGSRLWLGPTRDWGEFREAVTAILAHLGSVTEPDPAPLPVIAVTPAKKTKVHGAFDMGMTPPELLSDDPSINNIIQELMEKWAYHSDFTVLKTDGPDFTAAVSLEGRLLGTLEFTFNMDNPEHVVWEVSGTAHSNEVKDLHKEAIHVCKNRTWLKVWYDSGHTLSDGELFESRHRDIPFRGFQWGDFSRQCKRGGKLQFVDFDITKEKPTKKSKGKNKKEELDLENIGKTRSLFCWVQNFWPNLSSSTRLPRGWLACDDGAMEIADFIHLDSEHDPPVLSLIHVKGAGGDAIGRGLSVSKYEVVTGQAVKNLRSLDQIILKGGLRAGMKKKIGKAVWHNGRKSTRARMLEALDQLGMNYDRHVVIVQPHVTRTRHEDARENPSSQDAKRLVQLDMLLLSADASMHGAGATLTVIGDNLVQKEARKVH
jgi:hypothetical protein